MQEEQRRAAKGQLIALMRAGHPRHEAAAMAGVQIGRSAAYQLLLAQVCGKAGRVEEGLACIDEALAEVLRAIEIARSQQARSLELRATMSLARLWIAQQRSDDARRQLSDLYAWFTEGFETPDMQAARLLLAQL